MHVPMAAIVCLVVLIASCIYVAVNPTPAYSLSRSDQALPISSDLATVLLYLRYNGGPPAIRINAICI
jgi:hypothetical protein